jgi:hypothetical protein
MFAIDGTLTHAGVRAEAAAPTAMDAQDTAGANAPTNGVLPAVEADAEEEALIAAGHESAPAPAGPESAAGSVMVAADDDDAPIKARTAPIQALGDSTQMSGGVKVPDERMAM